MFRLAIIFLLSLVLPASAQQANISNDYGRLNSDAESAFRTGNYEEALRLSESARAIAEKSFGINAEQTYEQYARLGASAEMLGNYEDAAAHYRKLLAIFDAMYGVKGINSAFAMEMLGRVLCKLKQADEAERFFKSVIEIRKVMIIAGTNSFKDVNTLNLATLDLARGRWQEALARYRAAIDSIVKQGPVSTEDSAIVNTDPTNSATFVGLANAAWEIARSDPSAAPAMLNEAFIGAQWKWRTSASMALAKAAARGGGGPRAEQVRKVQDIKAQIQAHDVEFQKLEEGWLAKLENDPVYSELERKYRAAVPRTDDLAGGMQQMMANSHKAEELSEKYAKLLEKCGYTPECSEKYKGMQQEIEALVGQVGSLASADVDLAASERIKAQMDAREKQIEGYGVLPKAREPYYTRKAQLEGVLAREEAVLAGMKETVRTIEDAKPNTVAEVQVSLADNEALLYYLIGKDGSFLWVVTKGDAQWVRLGLNAPALKREVVALRRGLDFDEPVPFDRERAYALYQALLGQVEKIIGNKSLLIVASGPLSQLPFQVLVAAKPEPAAAGGTANKTTKWLVRDHALAVLPSVASLKTLRQVGKDSQASRPMVGFGNPLLNGPDASTAEAAKDAKAKSVCPSVPVQQVAMSAEHRGVRALDLRGGLADVNGILAAVPLPETAGELCKVAHDAGAKPEDVHLADRATEGEIKRLSAAGELAKYHVVHFATHGALAGEVSGNDEPGLLLTPPPKATTVDDGYLTASEIAVLKLDADWVILSACNTAAGGAEGGEELSGMAQAFFYAGARALLVSHWSVYSDATVKLITKALGEMTADRSVGRAEAMRRSMLALIDGGNPDEAHPAFWAPFVVVGEGAVHAP